MASMLVLPDHLQQFPEGNPFFLFHLILIHSRIHSLSHFL